MEQSKTSAGISAESAAKARSEISITRRYFADMLILMVVPAVMAWYYYGGRAVRLMVLSVLTAVLCEAAGSFIFKAQASVSDLSAVATGLMTALCMPASAPYYLPCRYRRKAAVRQCAFSYVYASSGRHSLCHNMYAG